MTRTRLLCEIAEVGEAIFLFDLDPETLAVEDRSIKHHEPPQRILPVEPNE